MDPVVSAGEQAWRTFQTIESDIIKQMKLETTEHRGLCFLNTTPEGYKIVRAVQRLGLAVMMKYNLKDKDFLLPGFFMMSVQRECVINLSLTTVDDMFNSKIFEWRDARQATPGTAYGNEMYIRGKSFRPEGYYVRPSLAEVLRRDKQEIKINVDGLVITYPEPRNDCILV
jgi:hypothetical protein